MHRGGDGGVCSQCKSLHDTHGKVRRASCVVCAVAENQSVMSEHAPTHAPARQEQSISSSSASLLNAKASPKKDLETEREGKVRYKFRGGLQDDDDDV